VRRGGLLAAALAVSLLLVGAIAAQAITFRVGPLEIDADGSVTPKALPADRDVPITFRLNAKLTETADEPLPRLERFVFDADEQGRFDTRGLPVCPASRLRATDSNTALRACKSALVGHGTTSSELRFPGQAPEIAPARLLMFYGGSPGGKVQLLMHVYGTRPVPTTVIARGVVGRGSGPYGTRTVVEIPEIAGGNGSLRSFAVTIHRTWSHKGKRHSFLVARCRSGRLVARALFEFEEGRRFQGSLLKECETSR
jgi:hypothetical protein